MSVSITLGLRLARTAGRSRILAVITCTALGTFLLVLLTHFPDAAHKVRLHDPRDDRVLYRLLTSIVALPVVAMIATISRLSSDTRDRRLASLRLMGASSAMAAVVAASEILALVVPGVLLGTVAGAIGIETMGPIALRNGWIQQVPPLSLPTVVAIAVLIATGVALAAARPARRRGVAILEQARPVPRRRLRGGWLVGAAGLAVATFSALRSIDENYATDSHMLIVGVGMLLLAIGLVSLVNSAIAMVARLMSRSASPTATVCAARLRGDRTSTSRALTGLVLAAFTSAIGLCVFTAWTTTPQYVQSAWAMEHPTTTVATFADDRGHALAPDLGALKTRRGIQAVEATLFLTGSVDGAPPQERQVISLSCAQLKRVAQVNGCTDAQPWVVADASGYSGGSAEGPGVPVRLTVKEATGTHRVLASSIAQVMPHEPKGGWGVSWLQPGTVVVPPSAVQALGIQPNAALVTIAPGSRVLDDGFGQSAGRYIMYSDNADWAAYDQVNGYRRLTLILIAAVVGVALIGVVAAVLDLLAERRRRVATLRMLGVPTAVLRRSQLAAVAIPLVVALVLAVLAGTFVGRGYLNVAGYPEVTPLRDLAVMLALMAALGCLLAVGTTAGLSRRLTAELIRRE